MEAREHPVIAAEVLKEYSPQQPSIVIAPRCRTVGDGLKDVPAERDDFGKTPTDSS